MRNPNNLFGTDAITKFHSWDLPISSFCNKIKEYKDDPQIIKEEIKKTFPEVFSEGLGRCTKMTGKIKLKKNAQPVFRRKPSIPFAAIDKIDNKLERLTQCRVLSRVDYSDWAAPEVYVKKKSGEIRVCADFSTGLNSAIEEDHHYPLPCPEEIFTKLKGRRYISKIDLSEAYLQIPTDDESSKLLIEVCSSTNAYPLTLRLHWR